MKVGDLVYFDYGVGGFIKRIVCVVTRLKNDIPGTARIELLGEDGRLHCTYEKHVKLIS